MYQFGMLDSNAQLTIPRFDFHLCFQCGTIAGNLSIKHAHKEFPSDMFIILEGCGATLTISDSASTSSSVSVADYLKTEMTKKVLLNVKLPLLDPNVYKFRSYKVGAHARNGTPLLTTCNFRLCLVRKMHTHTLMLRFFSNLMAKWWSQLAYASVESIRHSFMPPIPKRVCKEKIFTQTKHSNRQFRI